MTDRLGRRAATRARLFEIVTMHGAALEEVGKLGSRTGDGLTPPERVALAMAVGILRSLARRLVDG